MLNTGLNKAFCILALLHDSKIFGHFSCWCNPNAKQTIYTQASGFSDLQAKEKKRTLTNRQ